MKLIYQDVDIIEDVSINRLIHDMYAEAQADSLEIRFNDPDHLWEEWNPLIGDTITFEEKAAHTGEMYISSIVAENGFYTVRALSMHPDCRIVGNKSWEGVKFSQIAEEVAERHGMSCEIHDMENVKYPYMVQDSIDDIEFLQRLCELEGCAMLSYDKKIIIYNEKSMEEKIPSGTLSIDIDGVFKYSDNSSLLYKSAEVKSGGFIDSFEDSSVETSRVFRPSWPVYVNSENEAKRYAQNLLRLVNKNKYTGTIERKLTLDYAPASIIDLETVKAKTWDGSIFITRVRHDYMKSTTKLYFRKPLEGY